LQVAASLITTKYLLPEIRERNGAYGSSAILSDDGFFCLSSYRDPRRLETVKYFKELMSVFQNPMHDINEEDLCNAKLRTIQSIDKPKSANNIGMPLFLRGITIESESLYRRAVLSVTKEEMLDCMNRQLSNASYSNCIIGSGNSNIKENQ
ncbi:hypothetical protein GJ496_002546, partial [Pomphorhynchus laevis]